MQFLRVVLLLLAASLSAHAAITAGPEQPVSAPSFGDVHGQQYPLSVASDGTDFLTLWRDWTPGRDGIYATVVTAQGAVRPGVRAPLTRGPSNGQAVWTGDAYLVVLSRGGVTSALRLGRDGEAIAAPVDIGLPGLEITDLVWNGRRALALLRNGLSVTLALLDANGRVIRTEVPPIPDQLAPHQARIAVAGNAFVLVWSHLVIGEDGYSPQNSVHAMWISAQGSPGTVKQLMALGPGNVILDVASDSDTAAIGVLRSAQTTRDLHRFTIEGDTFAVASAPVIDLGPYAGGLQVTATAGGFVSTYTTLSVELGARQFGVIPFGSTSPRFLEAARSVSEEARLESNGHSVVAVWGLAPLRAMILDASLTTARSNVASLAIAGVRQIVPAIAPAGDVALYAWVEMTSHTVGVLRARRFDRMGAPLDAQPFTVAQTAAVETRPAVVFTGQVWLVAWQAGDNRDARVLVRRVSPAGELLDVLPVDLGTGSRPVAAFNGSVAVVAFTTFQGKGIRATRFSAAGTRSDMTPLTVTDDILHHPAIASNGQEFLVTWTYAHASVRGRRLDASGSPMDAAPIRIVSPGFDMYATRAQVASNGTDFLVVYLEYFSSRAGPPLPDLPPTVYRIYAKRVLRTGVLGDHTSDEQGEFLGEGSVPAVTGADGGYVVTFSRFAEGLDQNDGGGYWFDSVSVDARGNRRSAQRAVMRGETYSEEHSVATVGGVVWVAYPRVTHELGGVERVFIRPLVDEGTIRRRIVRR